MTKYSIPRNWLNYNLAPLIGPLTEAKAAVISLVKIPYQRSWVEALQAIQLKMEVAGTSRIEGADFTDRELELALSPSAEQLVTRSQRQAHAAVKAYRWISALPKDRPVSMALINEIHALIVTGADDDHCQPGAIRRKAENVTFGAPVHRGAEGGEECATAFSRLEKAIHEEFQNHDPLIQALGLHFHFAAMHPFLDGNGRTARAVEALMLQRSGLTDHLFIAMSNYYYDEKTSYLAALSAVNPPDYDLTQFLLFGLKGIKNQCERLFEEIRINVLKSIYRNTMYDLFNRLENPRKRVVTERQLDLLKMFLERGKMNIAEISKITQPTYSQFKAGNKALIRDILHLYSIDAIEPIGDERPVVFKINLEWPQTITENGFMTKSKRMPKAKTLTFLSVDSASAPHVTSPNFFSEANV